MSEANAPRDEAYTKLVAMLRFIVEGYYNNHPFGDKCEQSMISARDLLLELGEWKS